MPTDAASPGRALALLRELSPRARPAAVLDGQGRTLAGEAPPPTPAPGVVAVEAHSGGVVVRAHSPAGALAALARADAAAAAALAGESPSASGVSVERDKVDEEDRK